MPNEQLQFYVPDYANRIGSEMTVTYDTYEQFSYTVPQDGFISAVLVRLKAGFTRIRVNGYLAASVRSINTTMRIGSTDYTIEHYQWAPALIPVKKGDVITMAYTATDTQTSYIDMYPYR